jgi:hypothetical protein
MCNKMTTNIFRVHNHNLVLSSFMTRHWICNNSNTKGVTCGAGTIIPSEAPEFTPWFLVGFMLLDL